MSIPIPSSITVHLGLPNETAPNVTVSFLDYIKNVASSEIYPTWPETSLRANILAQISFALNRKVTEFYRARGYDFDITSTTAYDQKFIPDREIFQNISVLVDEIFSDYIVRRGSVIPLFAQYCNGTTSTCNGLSQWGTVSLAQQGKIPYEILQNYYGEDIDLVFDAPISDFVPSYPGAPLRLGSAGEPVRTMQQELNRIAVNYPLIGQIPRTDGIFDLATEEAVRTFQDIFDLTVDGIVGPITWYAIRKIYNAVAQLSELTGEVIPPSAITPIYPGELSLGDRGDAVSIVQYYLTTIAFFDPALPYQTPTGIYDEATEALVRTFQAEYGIPVTGTVDRTTWNRILSVFALVEDNFPDVLSNYSSEVYPGQVLSPGIRGEDVTTLQGYLNQINQRDGSVPPVPESGVYDAQTEEAVRIFQSQNGLTVSGLVGPLTWNAIVRRATGRPDSNAPALPQA